MDRFLELYRIDDDEISELIDLFLLDFAQTPNDNHIYLFNLIKGKLFYEFPTKSSVGIIVGFLKSSPEFRDTFLHLDILDVLLTLHSKELILPIDLAQLCLGIVYYPLEETEYFDIILFLFSIIYDFLNPDDEFLSMKIMIAFSYLIDCHQYFFESFYSTNYIEAFLSFSK